LRRGLLPALGAVAVATAARADAPTNQYGPFDGTNLVIVDKNTMLTWERYVTSDLFTFTEAASHCATGTHGDNTTGWRVPSYKELLTIVDEVPHFEYENLQIVPKSYDSHAFYGTPVDAPYWSSSPTPFDSTEPKAFVVDFFNGQGQSSPMRQRIDHVRCVR
jgi:hypothetical protein